MRTQTYIQLLLKAISELKGPVFVFVEAKLGRPKSDLFVTSHLGGQKSLNVRKIRQVFPLIT